MTDTTQGQDIAPNDNALFNEAVSTETTLAKFENPEPPKLPEIPAPPAPTGNEPPKPGDPPKPDDNAPVPPGRLREEAERARKAERERDALQARIDALMATRPQQPPAPAQQPSKVEFLDDPGKFLQQELAPLINRIESGFQSKLEAMSLDNAQNRFGHEKVDAAFQALRGGMLRGDPQVKAVYDAAMNSHDPYGAITRWHMQGETIREIGPDLGAFRQREREALLNDPEFIRQAVEKAKGQASATGNTVARPVAPRPVSSPSLANIGGGGGDQQVVEPSDDQLFRQATTAKRR